MSMFERDLEKYFVFITLVSSFFSVFITNGVIIGAPAIGLEYGMDNVVQNWIPTILVLVVTIFTLPAGQLCGKFGFKRSLIIGQAVILAGLVLCCLSTTTDVFFASRIMQGIGIAIANVAEMAIIVLAIGENNRGKALGIIVTGVYLGTSISPVICGVLVENFGWRSMFYITIFFNTICTILLLLKINEEWTPNKNDTIDIAGMCMYMVGIFLLIYGITVLNTDLGKICAALGIVILIGYGLFELRVKTPAFEVRLFENRPFTFYNIAGLCGYLSIMALTTIFNYHFQYVRGWDAQLTGLILLVSPVVMSITAPNAGKLSDKIHPQKIAVTGMTISIFGFIILLFLDANTSLYVIILAMILTAAGMGMFSSPNMNAIMSAIDEKYASHGAAAQLTMRGIGQTLSLSFLTLAFAWVMGTLPLAPQYAGMIVESSQIVCGICAAACIIAIATSLIGLRYENRQG